MRAEEATPAAPETADEPERIKVGIAEYAVTSDGATLTTSGLGSCIGLALHDPAAGIAGLVHVMLPVAGDQPDAPPAKFADTGTDRLLEAIVDCGGREDRLEAKLAGGSDMLGFCADGEGIGERNVQQVRQTLASRDVAIGAQDVGGDYGRSLRLDGDTGDLVVTTASRETLRL